MEQSHRSAYLIDPKTRTVSVVPVPTVLDEKQSLQLTPQGDALLTDPLSPFEQGVYPFIFNPIGLQLGQALVVGPPGLDPTIPLPAVERHIIWVASLMVCNGITSIIPARKD